MVVNFCSAGNDESKVRRSTIHDSWWDQSGRLAESSAGPSMELWDEIMDYLAAHPSEAGYLVDLKSASQSYIFRSISVRNLPGVSAPIVAERLLQLLTASPHLIQYVRELEVFHGDSEVMRSVAQIPWTSVYQLTLGPVDPTPGSLILEVVAVLVGLSSLRSLVFRSGRWDASQYFHIFASCASGVKHLTFLSCRISPAVLHVMPKTAAKPTYLGIGLASAEDPSSGLSFGARAVHSPPRASLTRCLVLQGSSGSDPS
ncbi:hypothetical protein FB451DRAFT_1477200 [Mycena latifolia]|nr:hypothetical protein FB451DRAFT_1477200 [Mycena latifolia]